MEAIASEQVGPLTVEVHYDEDTCSSPREDDNLGTLAGYSRYTSVFEEQEPYGVGHAYRAARYEHGPILALPVYVRSQSYTIVSETSDWGYADGIYYTPLAQVSDEFPGTFAEQVAAAKLALRSELDALNAYLAGEVYGYIVKGPDGGVIASCWGFVGEPEYAATEGEAEAHALVSGLPAWVQQAWAIAGERVTA